MLPITVRVHPKRFFNVGLLSLCINVMLLTMTKMKTKQEIKTHTKGKGLVVDLSQSWADWDRVSLGRTKRSERPRAWKRVKSIDREKQSKIHIWPKKKQCYGYHDRSPSRNNHFSKSLRVSGAFKHLPPQYADVLNDHGLLLKEISSFRITKQILV
jgi:hypothetical protein